MGLSGIAKQYGYQTVQELCRACHAAPNAYADYQGKAAKWEETYGAKAKGDTLHSRILKLCRKPPLENTSFENGNKGKEYVCKNNKHK